MAPDRGLLSEMEIHACQLGIEVTSHSSAGVRELYLHCLLFESGSRAETHEGGGEVDRFSK